MAPIPPVVTKIVEGASVTPGVRVVVVVVDEVDVVLVVAVVDVVEDEVAEDDGGSVASSPEQAAANSARTVSQGISRAPIPRIVHRADGPALSGSRESLGTQTSDETQQRIAMAGLELAVPKTEGI